MTGHGIFVPAGHLEVHQIVSWGGDTELTALLDALLGENVLAIPVPGHLRMWASVDHGVASGADPWNHRALQIARYLDTRIRPFYGPALFVDEAQTGIATPMLNWLLEALARLYAGGADWPPLPEDADA